MRIERLSDSRVRVTLTNTDLVGLNISVEQLRPDSKELHTFLFNIMETIRSETDFNPYNGQVVVEAMPSSEGISIIISKIHTNREKTLSDKSKRIKSITPHIKKKAAEVFCFECMDDLCNGLSQMEEEVFLQSSLYRMDGKYYFILSEAKGFVKSISVLLEYSSKYGSGMICENFVREHGSLVAEHESLMNMANGIKNLE